MPQRGIVFLPNIETVEKMPQQRKLVNRISHYDVFDLPLVVTLNTAGVDKQVLCHPGNLHPAPGVNRSNSSHCFPRKSNYWKYTAGSDVMAGSHVWPVNAASGEVCVPVVWRSCRRCSDCRFVTLCPHTFCSDTSCPP